MNYNQILVNSRCWCIASLFLALGSVSAYADATYQRTKDGKTLIWNNYPEANEAADWSGKRDSDRYATGPGTLTWLRKTLVLKTGSNIAADKYIVVARYKGTMV